MFDGCNNMNDNLKLEGRLEHHHFGSKPCFYYGHELVTKQTFVHFTFHLQFFLAMLYKIELKIV
jgi:hypothetical protein